MITKLKINNIALIDESLIEFENGANVLTGETGAGKSIIIDSLNFVLGSRADKTLIKSGKESAKVEVIFELPELTQEIINFFESILLEPETTLIISRTFNITGKNECRVNGEVVTLNMLKKLTCELVDIFGQNDHHLLLDTKNHARLLDKMNHSIQASLQNLNVKLSALKEINRNIDNIGGTGEVKEKNILLLKHEIDEIEMANLTESEEEELKNKRTMFMHSEKLANNLSDAKKCLASDESNIVALLKNASFSLSQISHLSADIESLHSRIKSAVYEISDISETISQISNNIEYSEEEANQIEERLDLIKDLKRKYGKTYEEIINYLENAKNKLNQLLHTEAELNKLHEQKQIVLKEIYEHCLALTKLRKETGEQLSKKLVNELKELGINKASFIVSFNNDYSLENIEKRVNGFGADNIEFLFSANPGVEPRPLSKIISGGEMSRFMLAFKCVVKDSGSLKTLVFDEIDAGIGGLIGIEVAKKIAKISKNNQVLCVTHLAQIASYGDVNFKIEKTVNNNFTNSSITKLNENEKIKEITRMLGSKGSSEVGKLNAIELVSDAKEFKLGL